MNESELQELLMRMGAANFKQVPGSNLMCSCPFARWKHADGKDSKNSFSIQVFGKNLFKCWACGITGGVRSLVKNYEEYSGQMLNVFEDNNASFEEKLQRKKASFAIVKSLEIKADEFYRAVQMRGFDEAKFKFAMDTFPNYALHRGVDVVQIKKYKIGMFTSTNELFIPVYNREQKFVGYSRRTTQEFIEKDKEKYKHAGGFRKEMFLYGENFLNPEVPIAFVSEGFFDVWNLDKAGLPNAFGSMGTHCSKEQAKILKQFQIVIVFPHNDKKDVNGKFPGMMMAESFREELTPLGVHVIFAPFQEGKKDVGEWTVEEIKRTVKELLDNI